MLASPTFLQGFLRRLNFPDEPCDIHTQYSYALEDEEEIPKNKGWFDLLITSKDSSTFAVIIEVKVWSGFGWKQPEKYKEAKTTRFQQFKHTSLVSITPFPDRHQLFDDHIQWGKIAELLENTPDEQGIQLMLRQFAVYLKDRGLGMVTLDLINPDDLNDWNRFAAVQAQWINLFAQFGMDEDLKKLFKRAARHPRPEVDEKRHRSWLGIYSPESDQTYYAGLGIMENAQAVLWVEVVVKGNHLNTMNRLPVVLQEPLKTATRYLDKETDVHANLGKNSDDGYTYIVFAQNLDADFNGKPEQILNWFKETIISARDFVTKECR